MSQKSQKVVRLYAQTLSNPRIVEASSIALPQSRPRELRMLGIDLALLVVSMVSVLLLAGRMEALSAGHAALVMTLNLVLAFVFGLSLQYLDLSDGRYSLGKAALMGFGLWLVNASMFCFAGPGIPWRPLLVSGMSFAVAATISGVYHYKISEPFMKKKTDSPYYRLEQWIKRAFDLTACALGLVAVSPLMLLVPVLICMESKGSAFFSQVRIGRDERRFSMYKFRSMRKDAASLAPSGNQQGTVLYKKTDDPRVTCIGRLIRKLSIDELPQLFNVLRGEMSLVGPRPPLENEFDLMNWHHKRKFEATPGLTGLWQVVGRVKNQRDFNSVAAYDIYYIENWCLMEDIRILLKTIPVVLLQKGAC